MFRKRFALTRALFVAVPALLSVACDNVGGGGDDDDDAITPTTTAELRVAHVTAAAPSLDVFVDSQASPLITNLAFGNGTAFFDLDAGSHTFDFSATGTSAGAAVLSRTFDLAGDERLTLAVFGPSGDLDALRIPEDVEAPAPGNVRVRMIHVATDVGMVDLTTGADGVAPAPFVTDLAFGTVSDVVEIPSAPIVLGLDADDDTTPDLLFEIPALPAGQRVNVFAVSDGSAMVVLFIQGGEGELTRIDAMGTVGIE